MGIPEFLYYIGLSVKRRYLLGHQRKLPGRVISIGNITVGGTGKTPATIALAREGKRRGFLPVILTRGYKGAAKGPCFVTKGEGPLLSAEEAGDEPLLMAEKVRGVPVVKGSNRYEAGMFALQDISLQIPRRTAPLLFILDDGFQHWKLYRDKDVLLIDAGNPFGNRTLLPLGKLREPLWSICRAQVIVLTKCMDHGGLQKRGPGGLIEEIKRYNAQAPLFLSGHSIAAVCFAGGEKISPHLMHGRRVFCFCALGNPESFRDTVSATGAVIAGFKAFRDHYKYSPDDILQIQRGAAESGAEWIVTTEKDMIKMRDLDLPGNILIIRIEFSVDAGFYDAVFAF
jgi:tetraacyldisaccharide 4'-kinase